MKLEIEFDTIAELESKLLAAGLFHVKQQAVPAPAPAPEAAPAPAPAPEAPPRARKPRATPAPAPAPLPDPVPQSDEEGEEEADSEAQIEAVKRQFRTLVASDYDAAADILTNLGVDTFGDAIAAGLFKQLAAAMAKSA
jgi:hypothetical protein